MKYLAHSSSLSLFLKPMLWNLLVVFKHAALSGYSSFAGYFISAAHLFSHSLCYWMEIAIELFEGENHFFRKKKVRLKCIRFYNTVSVLVKNTTVSYYSRLLNKANNFNFSVNQRSAMNILDEIMQVNAGNMLLSVEYYRSNK